MIASTAMLLHSIFYLKENLREREKREEEGGEENLVGSMASLHYVQIIHNIYSTFDIYQKGHHLKNEEKHGKTQAIIRYRY